MNWFNKILQPFQQSAEPKDYDFCIAIPTKGRYESLERAVYSIFDMALNPEKIEVHLAYDKGDKRSATTVKKIQKQLSPYSVFAYSVPVEPVVNLHKNYINPLLVKSNAKYLWSLGNDCEIITKDWDSLTKHAIEDYLHDKPDRIMYMTVDDQSPRQHKLYYYCCFPLLTRETVQLLGGIMPNEITSWGADRELFQIFKTLDKDRIFRFFETLKLNHYSEHAGWYTHPDEITRGLNTTISTLTDEQRTKYIKALNGVFKSKPTEQQRYKPIIFEPRNKRGQP